MSSRRRAVLVWLAGLGLALMLSLPVGCVDHSDAWKAAECIPDEPDKPPCPSGTICLKDDWSCHSLCEQSSSECESPVEGCFLPDGVCKVYRAECDPANPSCMEGFYCDSSGACTKKIGLGSKCTDAGECWSGVCQDGFCCTSCQDSCSACAEELTGRPSGTCAHILAGKKRGDQDCPDPLTCNGAGQCETRGLGEPCTEAEHCTSGFCADEVCCDAQCSGVCEACIEAETGAANGACLAVQANLDPHDECPAHLSCSGVAGACFDLGVGEACTDNGQCLSGHCVDGVCCETACNGICESCLASKTGGTTGSCDPIPNGADPDLECSGSFGCSGSRACISGAANGVACGQDGQCESGHCVDGVCCATACGGTCEACTAKLNLGAAQDGTCAPIPYLEDPETECAGGFGCSGGSACNPEKTWQPERIIETENAGDATRPRVAVGGGAATVVWQQSDGTRSNIWANLLELGGDWGLPTPVETDSTVTAESPVVGMDASGNAVAAWYADGDGTHYAYANDYVVGRKWGSPTRISQDHGLKLRSIAVAVNREGAAVAVWSERDGNGSGPQGAIWTSEHSLGAGWTTAARAGAEEKSLGFSPRVAVDDLGNATVVWQHCHACSMTSMAVDPWVNRLPAGSDWGTPVPLGTAHTRLNRAEVVTTAGGGALAVWDQSLSASGIGAPHDVWAAHYRAGDGWSGTEKLDSDSQRPCLASNGSDAFAVWTRSSGSQNDLYASHFTPGSGWSLPEAVETNVGWPKCAVAVDQMGNAVAAWVQHDGTRFNVRASRYVRNGGWGAPMLLENGIGDVASYGDPPLDIAMADDGSAVVVWSQTDGTRYNVWARVLE